MSTGVLGNCQGEVITKEGPLQLAIHIWPYQNGKQIVATADVLNRDVRDLFIDPIALNEMELHFEIHNATATYDGKLNAQGTPSRALGNNLVRPRHSCSSASKSETRDIVRREGRRSRCVVSLRSSPQLANGDRGNACPLFCW
jgi:hypothetical protein